MAAEPVTVLVVHRKKRSFAGVGVQPQTQGAATAPASAILAGEGTSVSSSVQDGLNSPSTVWISGSLLQPVKCLCDTVFLYVVLCIRKAAGRAKARCCWYTREGSAGRYMVYSTHTRQPVGLMCCKR